MNILVTAFEPYGQWENNSSWICLMELTRQLPSDLKLITRRYPVDFAAARQKLEEDLKGNPDFALFLGQAPGSAWIRLERFGLNIGGLPEQASEEFRPLVPEGPAAYACDLPLDRWAFKLRERGIPAQVSFHAGAYLCNAMLYWSHHLIRNLSLKTRPMFLHLPLEESQVLKQPREFPSLSAQQTATAVRILLNEISSM